MAALALLLILLPILGGVSAAGLPWEQRLSLGEHCAKGYFLSDLNNCLPCNCKGHSETCEDITGVCTHCVDHTTGDFCEMCEDGFMSVPSPAGHHACRPCACPMPLASNNFALHCDRGVSTLRCRCQEGYAGHFCERCSPGYYGDPMTIGNSCRRCDCNGNSDPNLIFHECHNVTGFCLNCWSNTAGTNCERCAPGFYGDAIGARNCQECECSACGTASCDDRTGVCHCKPGVTGRLCDRCEEGYTGFSSCQGCRRCDCGPAAMRPTCHPLTHSCQCRPGAGGRYCERCLPGHWDYSPTGCHKCDCASGHCDMHTGECLPEAANVNLCNISCDECIWHLIGDLRLSNKTLDQLKVSVLNVSTGAAANDRLKFYNYTAHRLQAQFENWREKSSAMRRQTGEEEEAAITLEHDITHLEEMEELVKALGDSVAEQTEQSVTMGTQLTSDLTDLNVLIEDMLLDWERYGVQTELDPGLVSQNLAAAADLLAWMRRLDLSPREPTATEAAAEAHELLRRVRQLEKKLAVVSGRVSPAAEVLTRSATRLAQTQELLRLAQATVQEATHHNHHNLLKSTRNKAKQERVTEEQEAVETTLEAAVDQLALAQKTLAETDLMVQNVTSLHAAVDGADQLLMDKTERLSLADRDLVHTANQHAEDLEQQANELEEDLQRSDANGFVQRALDASNVYNNIIKYIDDANITGLTTEDQASRAQDAISGINTQLSFLKTTSDDVFKQSVSLRSGQFEVEAETVDKVKYIEETKETMEENNRKLAAAKSAIDSIQKDRTSGRLQFSQEVALSTLNRSQEVLAGVAPVAQRVETWAANMHNNQYSTSAYDRALLSAGEAVDSLSVLVPELLEKLRVVEQKQPVNNVTTNILRIRELIAQARSVAKKVQVSMKFNGTSSVEVQPHANVEELKTVTSISLFVRVDPDTDDLEDRFIFYLGDRNGDKDYMGLAIKNDNLVYVYNLGGEDVEIPLSSKPVSQWPPVFNLVKVERLGRHGKVFLTVPSQSSTDEQKFIQKGEAPGTDGLLDLDPGNSVFIVGGVPAGVTLPPALSLAPFVGCIELASLNNDVISLYNFKHTHQMDVVKSTPCHRYKLAFSKSRIASYLFDGTGYALINNIERRGKFGIVTRFDIAVRTVANDGILFLMVNEANFFLLELKNGFLRLQYDFGFKDGPVSMDSNSPKLQINDARYHEVSVIYHYSKKIILLVDKSHVKSMENEKKTLPFSDIYIGGAPSSILSRPELASLAGLKGCVKGFQFQKKDFNLLEEPGTIGISSGCPEEAFMSRKAYFNGQGFLGWTAKISPFQAFEGGFNFRTLEPSGLLFYHNQGSEEFTISVENGGVVLNARGTKVKSQKKQYNDGTTHFLVASVTDDKYELILDDKDKHEKKRPASASSSSSSSETKSFYFGGSPSSSIKNFTGCISYAYINRQDRDIEPEDFQRYTENVQTSLQECPLERPPAALISKPSKNPPRAKHTRKVGRDDESGSPQGQVGLRSEETEPCYLPSAPRAHLNAHHYGGTGHSRQEYSHLPRSLSERSHFSLSLKTQSSFGLVFYASDASEDDYMAVFLAHGKLVYTFSVGEQKIKVKSQEKYNDGTWHDVVFLRNGSVGRLILDGLTVLEGRAEGPSSAWNLSSPIYVGGVPPGTAEKNIQRHSAYSFSGCVKNLQLDGRPLGPASHTFGVTPCFQGSSETGTYFSEEGGYVVLDETFNLGPRFDMVVEVRPRVASGVLLHVYTAEGEYLTMYIHQGAVVVLVNSGVGEFSTRVTPKTGLCDGTWHRITVIRHANVLQLDVDSEVNHVVGPLGAVATETHTPVFVGGAPESLLPEGVATRGHYTGCMRNLVLSQRPVSFSKAALVSGAVSVGVCPAA